MSKSSKQAVLNNSVEMIREYYEKEHKHNKDRIKYGIIAMLIIPIVFLILLFVVNSSKVIFLVMWIASLFIISGYLIAIEYKDYNMSENLKDIIGNENLFFLIMVVVAYFVFLLIEIQPRYLYLIHPSIFILSAYGIEEVMKKIKLKK